MGESDVARTAVEPERRLQQLQRVACVGFWELDLQTTHYTASDETYRICGLESREGPESPAIVHQVAHPADAVRFEAALAAALAEPNTNIDMELRVVWPTGETRWVKSVAEVLRDAHGAPIRVAGTLLDITDRKRVENSLRESQQRLQVLHQIGEAIRRESRTDAILEIALRVLGEEMHVSRCVFCHVDADGDGLTIPADYTVGCASIVGHARLSDFGPTAESILTRGRVFVLRDVRRELAPAEAARYLAIDVEANIACSLVHGGVLRALMAVHQTSPRDWTETEISLVQEVTERCWSLIEQRAAEAKLRESETLVQIASRLARVGGWRLTVPDLEVSWSDEVCAIYDIPFGTSYSFEDAIARYAPEYRDSIRAQALRCVRDGTPVDFEARLITVKGRSVWVRVVAQAERAAEGAIVSVHGAVQDITPRRNLEEQLRQSQKMEAVGRLAGGVAHDFNNLLSVVLGCSSLLLSDLPADDPLRTEVEEIRHAGERASQLTRQLLAFSRQQVLQPRTVDWNQIVCGMHTMLQRLLGAAITLELRLAADLGEMRADPSQLEQVVMNLVVNARDAMPEGGTVTIETANVDLSPLHAATIDLKHGCYTALVVTDTGVGMSPDTRAHIFEPFFTTKDKAKGTGLGLSTVHGIVTQSGGQALVQSTPGAGSTFKIYLPRVAAPHSAVEKPKALPSSPLGGSETILLAEDDDQVRNVVQSILRRYGYTVFSASNATDALTLCQQHVRAVDLLLTDVVMPGVNGFELAERVVGIRPGLKVVYMSGYMDDSSLRQRWDRPGVAFLQKPITGEGLLRTLRAVLGRGDESSVRT